MRFLFFTALLLAQADVEKEIGKQAKADQPKIAIDFFGKQISLLENDVLKAYEIISKFSLPPSDILNVSLNLDKIVSNPEEELRRGERAFAIYFVDEKNALASSDHVDDSITVFISTDENLAKSMDVPFPGVYAFSTLDKVSYKIPLEGKTAKNINAIIKTPIIGPISYENFGMYRATEMPLLYLFTKPEDMETTKKAVYEQAKKCKNVGKFVIIPYNASRISPEVFGFTEVHLPTLVFIKERAKFNLLNADTKDFESFISDVLLDKLEPFYASHNEPENNADLDVKVVTRNNLPNILIDTTKDRLLVFSSPDCGFCRTLKPILEEFGKIVNQHADDKLFVGSSDVTVNDITEFDVGAVPAIYLVKAETNEKVKLEAGDRNLENLMKFVREKGTHAVDLTAHMPVQKEEQEKADDLPIEEPVSEKVSDREEL